MAFGFCNAAKDGGKILLIPAVCALLWMIVKVREGRFSYLFFAALMLAGALLMTAELRLSPIEEALKSKTAGHAFVEGKLKSEARQKGGYTLILSRPQIEMDGREYRLPAIMVSAGEEAGQLGLVVGMRVRVSGRPELFEGPRNPGEFDYAGYYRSMKLRCRIKADSVEILDARYPPLSGWVKTFSTSVSEALLALCEEEDRGIYEALLLGDKSALDENIRALYQKNGIAHLLAVSGLHVSLIGMGLYGFLRKLGAGYGKAGIGAMLPVFFYGCLTGFGPSVFRAVLMLAVSFLAARLGRTYDLLSAASLALLLLAADAPFLLFTSGVQLSFGAVYAIGLGAEQLREWESGGQNAVWPGLFIQIFTFPIILYHFFEFPIYGIFLNLIVIPLAGYVVGSGILAVALYLAGKLFLPIGSAAASAAATFAAGAVGPGHYILKLYVWLCAAASRLPFYSVTAGRPAVIKIFIYYAVLFAVISLKRGNARQKKRRFLVAAAFSVMFLAFHPARGLEVDFLDVGQGDGIFLRTREVDILVDGGSTQIKNLGKSRLVPFLKSKGVSRLDFVFVSHGDEDHISGIRYLLETGDVAIDNLVFSCLSAEDEACLGLAKLQKSRGGLVQYMEKGDFLECGKLMLTAVYPDREGRVENKNGQSLVLLTRYGDFTMLLTGDVEESGEEEMLRSVGAPGKPADVPGTHPGMGAPGELSGAPGTHPGIGAPELPARVTVLKAAHHGSKTSTGQAFLERVNPTVTVLSYGENNSYGHPSGEVVERLEDMGTGIWRTAVSGAIRVKTDGSYMDVEGFIGSIILNFTAIDILHLPI